VAWIHARVVRSEHGRARDGAGERLRDWTQDGERPVEGAADRSSHLALLSQLSQQRCSHKDEAIDRAPPPTDGYVECEPPRDCAWRSAPRA